MELHGAIESEKGTGEKTLPAVVFVKRQVDVGADRQ